MSTNTIRREQIFSITINFLPCRGLLGRGFIKGIKMENKINTKLLSDLAKLSFSKKELLEFEKDMENIVSFAKKVTEAKAAPSSPVREDTNVLREDSLDCGRAVSILDVAPEGGVRDEYFRVPRVVAE
jgi:aspartyl/glutamyl-tRNA(Asn/Gln) amidotransferase C subunit